MMKRAAPNSDLTTVFATNAIFARSESMQSLASETGFSLVQAFDVCWPLHEYFLGIVRPRVIMCLGSQEQGSAYWLFKRKAVRGSIEPLLSHAPTGWKYAAFKSARMSFELSTGTLSCLVVGVRHPSYVQHAADRPEFSRLIAEFGTSG